MNSIDFLISYSGYKPGFEVLTDDRSSLTLEALTNEIKKLKEYLEHRSLAFILCENSIEIVTFYISCLKFGVVPVLFNSSINDTLLTELLEVYNPNLLFGNSTSNLFKKWKSTYCFGEYSLLFNPIQSNHKLHNDLALLLSTSGSTGSPKLVRLSYENIIVNTTSICESLNITNEDKPILSLPLNYTYGLSILQTHLNKGCKICLTNHSVLSREFWMQIDERGITTLSGVPYTYSMLKKLGFHKINCPSLNKMTQAGGKLSEDLIEYFIKTSQSKNIQFYIMYGQTEATARMSCLHFSELLIGNRSKSIGKPIPGGEFKLVDEFENEISRNNMIGELVYLGKNVSMGYARSSNDLALADTNNGVLKTGDLAMRDSEGYYYIKGRKKRMVKMFGNRIDLDAVETIARSNNFSCVCSGTDDQLILYTCEENEVDKLREYISISTGINHKSIKVITLDNFPRNSSGKILYSQLPN